MGYNIKKFHLYPYISEIITNAKWAISLIEKGEKHCESDFEKVKFYSLAVNTASSILQIAFINVEKASHKKERAEKRIELINHYYPKPPIPPNGLRDIRNSIQHFEERLDSEMFNLIESNQSGFAIIKDSSNNIESYKLSSDIQYERRVLKGNILKYWKYEININDLLNWCINIVNHYDSGKS